MPGWVLRICCVASAALLPVVAGLPVAILLLLLIPVAVECSREAGERLTCGAAIAALFAVCCIMMPEMISILAVPMCLAGGLMLLYRDGHSVQRGIAWGFICVLALCMFSMVMTHRYQGDLCEGLAEDMVNLLAARPEANQVLLRCYQMGLCSLEGDLESILRLLGPLAVTGNVKRELLYSLRSTLADSLEMLLPQVIVAWLMLTVVLSAAVPDIVRRKSGKQGRLPAFSEWQMTDKVLSHLNALVLVYFLVIFTDQPLLVMMGRLCGAAFQYAYMILGLAVMEGVSKRHGMVRFIRRLWMAACTLFAPFVLLILGVVDRGLDLRRLRHSTDDKGGY